MFQTVAYRQAAAGVSTSLKALTPLPDPTVHIEGTVLYVGALNRLMMVYPLGVGMTQARLDAPSLRRVYLPDLNPIDTLAEPASPALGIINLEAPLALLRGEGLQVFAAGPSTPTNDLWSIVNLCDVPILPVKGEIFTIRCTVTTATTANAWSNQELVFGQTLPVGRYQVVGAAIVSATGLAFRLVPIGGGSRAGGMAQDAVGDIVPRGQRYGGWGVWCEFDSHTPPSIDFLTIAAETPSGVFLDLIKVA